MVWRNPIRSNVNVTWVHFGIFPHFPQCNSADGCALYVSVRPLFFSNTEHTVESHPGGSVVRNRAQGPQFACSPQVLCFSIKNMLSLSVKVEPPGADVNRVRGCCSDVSDPPEPPCNTDPNWFTIPLISTQAVCLWLDCLVEFSLIR